jgi:proteasome lid subunit RPN8/RPN11
MISARDGEAVEVFPMRNATASPLRYTMDPMDQYRVEMGIDDAGLDLGAIYHSHTRSAPLPSQTDINLAAHPHALYVIVGLAGDEPDVRAWRIADGEVSESELVVE